MQKIGRMVADFGNSLSQFMVDGKYFEFPTTASPINERKATGLFNDGVVEKEELLKQLAIRFSKNGDEQYWIVGDIARSSASSNSHISKHHDKTDSDKVYVSFLAAVSFYHAFFHEISEGSTVDVDLDYFATLLPVWNVQKGTKFGDMLKKMAERFQGEHEVELLTPGFKRTLKIKVARTDCKIEGEISRLALKYDLELNQKDSSKQYEDSFTVISDIGGQTLDLSKLQKNLGRPASSSDFKSFTDRSWLGKLEGLREEGKFSGIFTEFRTFEKFVLENMNTRRFLYVDPVDPDNDQDFTADIEDMIWEMAELYVDKTVGAFKFESGAKVKFVYIGGVAQLLQWYIEKVIESKGFPRENHIFPHDSRKLNLYGLEIVAKNETIVKTKS